MILNDYRKARGVTYTKLAELLGASHATVVRRWCLQPGAKDRLIPSEEYMHRIMVLSNGQVTPNDFYRQRDNAETDA
jgi:transcriptional regulator with XRE-family HTH domain